MTRPATRAVTGVVGLIALLAGCVEEIVRQPPPGDRVVVLFDPAARDAEGNAAPVLPTPTDLVRDAQTGLLEITASPTDTKAQIEFNRYLSTLDGFPVSSTAEVRFDGELDAASVTPEQLAKAIIVLPVPQGDEKPLPRLAPEELTFAYHYDAAAGTSRVTISHEHGWARGATFALFVDGGALRGQAGEPVIRSATFELMASRHPICALDATGKCTHNYSSLLHAKVAREIDDDPANAEKSAEELALLVSAAELEIATGLEQLRRVIDGLLSFGEQAGLDREAVAVTWAFTTSSSVEALFDPLSGKVPFPANDLLLAREDDVVSGCRKGHVCLPPIVGETEEEKELRLGLNGLEGFATNGPSWAFFSGKLDHRTITGTSVRVINTSTLQPHEVQLSFDEEENALIVDPITPYAEKTRYAVVLISEHEQGSARATGGLADVEGNRVVPSPIFALARLREPLVVNGASQINGVDDGTAAMLEELRSQWEPLLAAAPAFELEREQIVLLWTFITQSITEPLVQLRALPWQRFGDPQSPVFDGEQPALTGELLVDQAAMVAQGLPQAQAELFGGFVSSGRFKSYDVLDPATGALLPPAKRASEGKVADVPFLLVLPDEAKAPGGTKPAAGWPVVYFHHGLLGDKEDALLMANALVARGFAVIANDVLFHGERSQCPAGAYCGPYFNPNNPFAMRDNLRQTVIDAAALLRAVKLGGADRLNGVVPENTPLLDSDRVQYLGQSLGGIVGTMLLAVDSLPQRGVLGVPGGPWVFGIATESAVFGPVLAGLTRARGLEPGSLGELQLLTIFQWVLDAADAVSFARFVKREPLEDPVTQSSVRAKSVIVQRAALDRTVPARATQLLADLIGVDTSRTTFAGQDHGFLLRPSPDAKATAAAQAQAALFLDNGAVCTPRLDDGTCAP